MIFLDFTAEYKNFKKVIIVKLFNVRLFISEALTFLLLYNSYSLTRKEMQILNQIYN
jgi:hypothetical protein